MSVATDPAAVDLADFRRRARAWLAGAEIPAPHGDLDERFRIGREWQRTLAASGWLGIHWPREFGGQGLTAAHHLVFTEELARARGPQPIGLVGLDVVGPTIARFGTDTQRRQLLEPLLSGDHIWCQGFSEPGAGSDLAALTTQGRIDEESSELVVTGQKVWTSWAHEAHWCAALVRTDPDAARHRGISYLLIDMSSPGISVRPIVQTTGDAEFSEVFFDEVRVPLGNVVGDLNDGWALAMDTLRHERGGYCVRRCVELEVAFGDLVQEVRAAYRTSGLTPDSRVLERLGELKIGVRALTAEARRTFLRIAEGGEPSAVDSVDKLLLTELEQQLYRVAEDLLGPYRMAPQSTPLGLDAERWIHGQLYARAASVYGGTSQIQRSLVAERLLGLPRSR